MAVLEDEDHSPEARRKAQDVDDDRLQRDENGAEGDEQDQVRHPDNEGGGEGRLAVQAGNEVLLAGGEPANEEARSVRHLDCAYGIDRAVGVLRVGVRLGHPTEQRSISCYICVKGVLQVLGLPGRGQVQEVSNTLWRNLTAGRDPFGQPRHLAVYLFGQATLDLIPYTALRGAHLALHPRPDICPQPLLGPWWDIAVGSLNLRELLVHGSVSLVLRLLFDLPLHEPVHPCCGLLPRLLAGVGDAPRVVLRSRCCYRVDALDAGDTVCAADPLAELPRVGETADAEWVILEGGDDLHRVECSVLEVPLQDVVSGARLVLLRQDGRLGDADLHVADRVEQGPKDRGREQDHGERLAHHDLGAAAPERRARPITAAPDGEPVDPRSENTKEGREKCERRQNGHEDNDNAGHPDRPHEHKGEEKQAGEPNQHRRPREEDGSSCGRHRARHSLHGRVVLEFLPETTNEEQGVVYAEPETEHRRERKREHGHVVDARNEVQCGERRHHARAPDQNRHTGGDERAEGEDEYDHGEGEGVFLSILHVLVASLLEVLVDGRRPCYVSIELVGADLAPNLVNHVASRVDRDIGGDHRVGLLPIL